MAKVIFFSIYIPLVCLRIDDTTSHFFDAACQSWQNYDTHSNQVLHKKSNSNTASIEAMDGTQIGPGGKPVYL